METMAARLQVAVGFSDHTMGNEVALAAVALGACVLEKHLTLDRSLPGPDHRASLEPEELGRLIRSVRIVESALGDGRKESAAAEENVRSVARRSIVARGTIAAGSVIAQEHLAFKRPGTGIPPSEIDNVIGRRARRTIANDTVIQLEDIA
jgi:N-acetylneuraminate synthase/N,N'-diacetyllegionaminate synthase